MRRTATAIALVASVAVVGSSCSTSGGSTTRACASFDRSYTRWRAAPGVTTSQRAKANGKLVGAIDDAVSAAGGTSLAEALELLGASLSRETSALQNHQPHQLARATSAIPVVVSAIRRTCPPD